MAPGTGRKPLRPSLPAALMKEIGAEEQGGARRSRPVTARKAQRKAARVEKKQRHNVAPRKQAGRERSQDDAPHQAVAQRRDVVKANLLEAKPPHRMSRPTAKKARQHDSDDEESEDDDDFAGFSGGADGESDDEVESADDDIRGKPVVSKTVKGLLAEDDAEIADLEKKLGIRSGKKQPKSFHEDGLDALLGDLSGTDDERGDLVLTRKRKAEADDWLAQKRRKAMAESEEQGEDDDDGDEDEGSDSDSDSHSSSGEEAEAKDRKPTRIRENPYVAPTTTDTAAPQKYVPPARRQETGSDAELLSRVRRQAQGLVNRLTEANLVPILGDVEKLYRDYPRQHVTSTLIDLLLVQICEPTSLPDTLLILTAGFSTAVYKVIGSDFGAQLVQRTVEKFQEYYVQAILPQTAGNATKQTSNLVTFMAEIYNFQLMGCNLIFDYIRLLLDTLSELNAELLLRIARRAGRLLRRDDPLALKDIVALIRPAVAKVGRANLSVRTKFMIETIDDLKNNKLKAGVSDSAVAKDHATRIKKLLGSLNSRKLKATEPLRIGLKDIEESDKRGKWWLVGASWAGRDEGPDKTDQTDDTKQADATGKNTDEDGPSSESDSDAWFPRCDLAALAREMKMNTDVRRAIFIALMGSVDCEHARIRLAELRLNKHGKQEIPYVVMRCAESEEEYNPFYTLVARQFCEDRKVKFAFRDGLWRLFRRLGEPIFGEQDDGGDGDENDENDENDEADDVRRIGNLGRMFGTLVADGALGLDVLKCLSLTDLRERTSALVQVMLARVFLEARGGDAAVARMFETVAAGDPGLSAGLLYFLRRAVRRTDVVARGRDLKRVRHGCEVAAAALVARAESTGS